MALNEIKAPSGALGTAAGNADFMTLTAPGDSQYAFLGRSGRIYHACTAESGVAPGTALSTTSAFTLHNPAGSGRKLVVVKASMGYLSGTLGAGFIMLAANVNPLAAAPSGTAITPTVSDFSVAPNCVGRPLTTATLAAAPNPMRPLWTFGAALASSVAFPVMLEVNLEGDVVVSPGCAVSLQGVAAAGTTPKVLLAMSWYEVAA